MKTTMAWSKSWQICVRCRRLAVHSSGFGSSARTKRGRLGVLPGAGEEAAAEADWRAATWVGGFGCGWVGVGDYEWTRRARGSIDQMDRHKPHTPVHTYIPLPTLAPKGRPMMSSWWKAPKRFMCFSPARRYTGT